MEPLFTEDAGDNSIRETLQLDEGSTKQWQYIQGTSHNVVPETIEHASYKLFGNTRNAHSANPLSRARRKQTATEEQEIS